MRFSVIIPSHSPTFLKECLDSVVAQTFKDFEVVIVPNNGAKVDGLFTDKRIRVVDFPLQAFSIGQLKNFAFSQGKGDILVELDHDDILSPNCLERLHKAYKDGGEFVYSQCAYFRGDFTKPEATLPFDENLGWTYKKLDNGLITQNLLPLFPKTMAYIWFEPDHVRSFTRALYEKVGGHSAALSECDDQDLMIRMYLAKANFVAVNECLYYYRRHDGNSFVKRQENISLKTCELRNEYLEHIALEWARRNSLMAVDLCGGMNKVDGYLSVDLQDADMIADLNEPWPFKDGSVGVLRASDALEHLIDKEHVMKEAWRVLAHGGVFFSLTPSATGQGAFQDPTHKSYWVENTFRYYCEKHYADFIRNDKIKFHADVLRTMFPSQYHQENNIPYIQATLMAIKSDERFPGNWLI